MHRSDGVAARFWYRSKVLLAHKNLAVQQCRIFFAKCQRFRRPFCPPLKAAQSISAGKDFDFKMSMI